MSEQFMDKGIWIVVAAAVGAALFFLLWRWSPWIVRKLVPEQLEEQRDKVRRGVRLTIAIIGGIILGLGIAAVAVTFYGVDLGPTMSAIGQWFLDHGIRIAAILLVGWFVYKILGIIMPIFIRRYVTQKSKRRTKGYMRQRANTLGRVVTQAIGLFLLTIAFFMILSELNLDITPLLAGAGVAGIAIGFAAQNSIRDFIGGFVIMMEDHYNVGDIIKVADITGNVEELGLRRTVLRDLKGILHVVPNGEIRVSSNYTRSISRAFFEVGVAYKEDLDQVMDIVRITWEEMAKDPDWKAKIISETPWLLRVEEFGDSGIIIRAVGDTRPMEQWAVLGEFRRRIKIVFDKEGIEIPWPHIKLYYGEEKKKTAPPAKPTKGPARRKTRPAPKKAPRGGGLGEDGGEGGGDY
ncbi:MAG: mechanosensitive ion channel family protein [Dehalococcoidia bacterium]|jgi:small conductance mechanosensitive channel